MKNIKELVKHQPAPKSRARNAKEDLIEQIVGQTTVRGKQADELKRQLAITANTLKWTPDQLHVLLQKKHDPKIRNYTGFVKWAAIVTNKMQI